MTDGSNRYHHGNLREALVEHALTLLAEQGLDGLSLRQVAARAGVSRSAPYHHFQDKDALVAAVVQHGFEQLGQAMQGIADGPAPGPLERVRRAGQAYVTFALSHPALYRIMFGRSALNRDLHPDAVDAADATFAMLERMVVEGQQSGHLAAGESDMIALAAWSTVHGVSSLLLDRVRPRDEGCHDQMFSERDVEEMVSAVLHTLECGLRLRQGDEGAG